MLLKVALHSLANRKAAAWLTLLSIVVSVTLLIAVEHLRVQAKQSFGRTVSGVDLIVGAPTGATNLLLYSVFRMGNPTNSIRWQSYKALQNATSVDWAIPISLGDSYQGFRVMGTTIDYLEHFKYGSQQSLRLAQGKAFQSPFDAMLGADVAKQLGFKIGDKIVLSHGLGSVSFSHHDHAPFVVSGILAATGTPIDKTIHISLQGAEVAHMSQQQAEQVMHRVESGQDVDIEISAISAIFVGLKSKVHSLQMQSVVNRYQAEPLMAIIPGVALTELWELVGNLENILLVVSIMVLISSLLGLATMLLTSIRERKNEMAVLRAIGAKPWVIFVLIQAEAMLITVFASLIGVGLVWLGLMMGADLLAQEYGLFIDSNVFTIATWARVGLICCASFVLSAMPAISAYRHSLQQGLTAR
ncbi:ABC transporter permease [Aliiglaciecola litoralis]|uniref:ABC transporter permease n=1 Tax=Aliiglaciecola litoralis TaxID=582857 RepID=A0ABN1LD22_9ALTE